MFTARISRTGALIASTAIVGSIGLISVGSPASAAPPAGHYSGGTTTGAHAVDFTTDGSTLTDFRGEVDADCGPSGVTWAAVRFDVGTVDEAGAFAVSSSITGGTQVVSGTIADSGSASGVMNLDYINANGEHCVSGDVAWTATNLTPPPTTGPPVTDPPVTDPPTTGPPATEPPTTAPATSPPATDPPTTEAPAPKPVVTVSSAIVQPGTAMSARGWGFQPGETVTAIMFSTPQVLGTKVADANGNVSFTWTLDEKTALGEHEIVLGGAESGASASASFQVAEDLELPQTGSSSMTLVVGASIAFAAGGALLGIASRRRADHG